MPDRALILKSPGTLSWDGLTIHSNDDITVTLDKIGFDVETSAFGKVAERVRDKRITITVTPTMWDGMAKLFPYAGLDRGASIYGGTDRPMTITPRKGKPITVANVAVTQLPTLTLSADKAHIGQMTFTGIIANNADPAATASYYSVGAEPLSGSSSLTGFDGTKVRNADYTAAFKALTGIRSAAGFVITPQIQLADDADSGNYIDGIGTIDMSLDSISLTVGFAPTQMSEDDYLTLLGGFAEAIGASLATSDFVITGGGLTFTVKNALVRQAQLQYGGALRTGAIEAHTIRAHNLGDITPLWTIA